MFVCYTFILKPLNYLKENINKKLYALLLTSNIGYILIEQLRYTRTESQAKVAFAFIGFYPF